MRLVWNLILGWVNISLTTYIKWRFFISMIQGRRKDWKSGGDTVLRFGVKVAVLQIFKCFKNWQKWFQYIVFTSIECILSKNNQFAIEKFANLSQIHDYLFWFWLFMPLYYWKMLVFFSLFLLLGEIRRVLSAKMAFNQLKISQKIDLDSFQGIE